MSDNPELATQTKFRNPRWDWLTEQHPHLETTATKLPVIGRPIEDKITAVIASHEDPLYGMSENAKNAQENSGNWGAQAVIDKEQARITDKLKSTDQQVRTEAAGEAIQLRTAVREGGSTLNHYIESREDLIESSFDQARGKAENKPKEDEGQTAAIDLIVAESDSIKHDLSAETTPDKAGKLQKLAGMASMLEGVAGENPKGLRHLKVWLEEKSAEISAAIASKQQELNLDQQLSELETSTHTPPSILETTVSEKLPATPVEQTPASNQTSTSQEIKPESNTNAQPVPEPSQPESQDPPLPNPSPDASAETIQAIRSALSSGDESLLPADSASPELIQKSREMIAFKKQQTEIQKKITSAKSWVSAKSS